MSSSPSSLSRPTRQPYSAPCRRVSPVCSVQKTKKTFPYLGSVGSLARVVQISRLPGVRPQSACRAQEGVCSCGQIGRATLVLEGKHRISLQEVYEEDGILKSDASFLASDDSDLPEGLKQTLVSKTRELIESMSIRGRDGMVTRLLETIEMMEAGDAADSIGSVLATSFQEKAALLNEANVAKRGRVVLAMVEKSKDLVQKAIAVRKQNRLSASQQPQRFMELQSDDNISALLEKIKKRNPPKEVLEAAQREAKKLQKTSEMHPVYGMSRSYLETLASVPFNQLTSEAQGSVEHARAALDAGHYGLQNAKQRILEYVAVQKISQNAVRGPILCFVGPPGVGKTSLAEGMAKALGRKYVRVSLGGVRDEAEIRGHRRTYIGAMPGRIITIGVSDCVMLLDELDKMGHDFRGNPAAALLEVLDPEQNHAFVDTYLGPRPKPCLSRELFCEANKLNELPAALLDRLEVIKLSGYTIQEKINIAQKHLIPKVMAENGLKPLLDAGRMEFPDAGLRCMIQEHTMEVGVRGLERCLSSICRHCAAEIVQKLERRVPIDRAHAAVLPTTTSRTARESMSEEEVQIRWDFAPVAQQLPVLSTMSPFFSTRSPSPRSYPGKSQSASLITEDILCTLEKIVVDEKLIEKVLGHPKHQIQSPDTHLQGSGVAAGLVWTPVGGSVQYIECCITKRDDPEHQGVLTLTGQLGEVLEESAQIAMSWIKSHTTELQFPSGMHFQNCDVHIHLPSGGVQKDGPSAGITLAVALISLFSGRQVRRDTAMTGELSLRGLVLPIGGLKEKLIAAQQAGLQRVIIPEANRKELEHDIPEDVKSVVEIYRALTLDDVLLLAFDPPYLIPKAAKL